VAERRTHEDLLDRDGPYAHMWRLQQSEEVTDKDSLTDALQSAVAPAD
jgi:hypothetical protein